MRSAETLEDAMLRQWRERKLNGRRSARWGRRGRSAPGVLTWAQMTPYQRWIVEAGRKEPRIPVTEGTEEEILAWMQGLLREHRKA